jgi:hypothetical protein
MEMPSETARDAPSDAEAETESAPPWPPSHCDLVHPFFQFFARRNDGWFTFDDASVEPVFVVRLDASLQVNLAVAGLNRELRLDQRAPADARLLPLVVAGVGYVDKIPLGGALPSEVLNGNASWPLPAQYLRAGGEKLAGHLSEWVKARSMGDTQLGAEILRLAERVHATTASDTPGLAVPETAGSPSAMSEASGYRLAASLGYLLCLRQRKAATLGFLLPSVEAAARVFHPDSAPGGAAKGLRRALEAASTRLGETLDAAERMPEICAALRQADVVCAELGRQRNALHVELRHLEGMARAWRGVMIAADRKTRALVFDTYRAIARRDLPAQQWRSLESKLAAALLPEGVRQRSGPVSVSEVVDLMKRAKIW